MLTKQANQDNIKKFKPVLVTARYNGDNLDKQFLFLSPQLLAGSGHELCSCKFHHRTEKNKMALVRPVL